VSNGAVSRRYAGAVFEIAQEQGATDRWLDDLRTLGEYFDNRRLQFILREPKVRFERKEAIVRDLLGTKIQREALNLALVLVERGLVDLAPAIRDNYEKLYNDYRGQAVAQVTTAIPLDDDLRERITRQLHEITGKRILLQEHVDPAILGGAIARVGDTLIDGSLRHRFALLRDQIAQGGSFGGPDDGFLADLRGPDGGSGGGGAGDNRPFVVGPTGATDMSPRASDGPRMQPRNGGNGGGRNRRRRR
jgi:F-type H+-transporting ATPase subunit delta